MNKIIVFLTVLSLFSFGLLGFLYSLNIQISTTQIFIVVLAILIVVVMSFLFMFSQSHSQKKFNVNELIKKIQVWWFENFNEQLSRLEGKWHLATYYNPVNLNEKKTYFAWLARRIKGEKTGSMANIIYSIDDDDIVYANDEPEPEELDNPFINFQPFLIPLLRGKLVTPTKTKAEIKIPAKLETEEEFEKLEKKEEEKR
jgi:hypothetical protein